ncbi:MAG: heme-binding Shp domain-containing protein [Eubacteriales bacterium]
MKLKKLGAVILSTYLMITLSVPAFAMEQGAYSLYCGTNYWNPDTNEIEDGGTANAALGEGMCRSATSTKALVEKEGEQYYVTIRLLLQSNTKDVAFYQRTGYNSYRAVNYDIMAEDASTDSIDYRFAVSDPFAPIRATMYVTPMGRSTVWFIELDRSSLSSDTGDFVVSVSETVPESAPEEPVTPEQTPDVEEPLEGEPVVDEVESLQSDLSSEGEETPEEPLEESPEEETPVEAPLETEDTSETTTQSPEISGEVVAPVTTANADILANSEPQEQSQSNLVWIFAVIVIGGAVCGAVAVARRKS